RFARPGRRQATGRRCTPGPAGSTPATAFPPLAPAFSMIPNEPPRRPQLGFLYIPPYRVQGLSVAGEQSVVQIPELDVCFDISACPRAALTSNHVALTHGHMDHAGGLAYYFSQRNFQGMGVGTVVCHPALEEPIHGLMRAWIPIENQRTPYKVDRKS